MMAAQAQEVETGKSALYYQLVTAVVATMMIVLPFYNGSTTAMGLALSEILLLSLGLLALIGHYLEQRKSISLSTFELVILAFLLTAAISALNATYPIDAWRAVGAFVLFAIGFRVSFSSALRNGAFARLILTALLVSGVIQSIVAIHQFFFTSWYAQVFPGFYVENLAPNIRGGVLRVVGGFINPNYLAAFLNICLAVGLATLLFKRLRPLTLAAVALADILFLVTIVLSGSKGALLVTALVVTSLLALKDKRFLLGALVIIFLIVAVPNPVKEQFERAITSDPYISMRPEFWQATWQMTTDNPLFGVGPNSYHFVSPRYAPSTDFLLVRFSGFNRIAHNAFLHMLAELGIVGTIPLLVIFIIGVSTFKKIVTFSRIELESRPLLVGIVVALVGVMLHSLVDNAGLNRCILVITVMIFGPIAAWASERNDANFTYFNRQWKWLFELRGGVPELLAVVILILGFAVAQIFMPLYYEFMVSDISGRVEAELAIVGDAPINIITGRSAGPAIGGTVRHLQIELQSLESLAAVFPDNLKVRRLMGEIHRELFRFTGKMSHFYDSLSNYEQATKSLGGKSSLDYSSILRLYFDLKEEGYPKTAEILNNLRKYVDQAIENYPSQAVLYRMAAMIEIESNRPEDAIQLLERAIVLEPNYLQAIADLGMLAVRTNRNELAQRVDRLYSTAIERIGRGPRPDPKDAYANKIIRKPTVTRP